MRNIAVLMNTKNNLYGLNGKYVGVVAFLGISISCCYLCKETNNVITFDISINDILEIREI
jgi:hypothetical protein